MATRKSNTTELTPAAFLRIIKSREQGSFYAFVGEDSLVVDALFKNIKETFVEPGSEDFNLEVIHANSGSVSAADIINAAETMPFLGGFRVVLVRHADELGISEQEVLDEYLQKVDADPRPDMILIVCFNALDNRKKFTKSLKKCNAIVNCQIGELKNPNKVVQDKYNKSFQPQAEAVFSELIGKNARVARNELEKLCLYLGDRQMIEVEDVLNVCADNSTRNEWDLVQQMLKGDFAKMIELLAVIRKNGLDPIYLHTILTMSASKTPLIRQAYLDGSLSNRSREFRINTYSADFYKVKAFLGDLTNQNLINSLRYLMFAEIAVKSSSLSKTIIADMASFLSTYTGKIDG